MKYLAALVVGIGLMAHNSASAETLDFGPPQDVPMELCIKAAKAGFKLQEDINETSGKQRFLIKRIAETWSWQVYEINFRNFGQLSVRCTVRSWLQ